MRQRPPRSGFSLAFTGEIGKQGQFAAVAAEVEQATAGLQHLKQQIATTANYHQQG